jgi:transposase
MDERLKFIARLLDGEKMAGLCREFGISRKTGYKILTRYNEIGLHGLTDRSRRPYRHANQLPFQIEAQIVRLKQDKPSWGAPKIRERLSRLYPDVHTPAISTVHAVLDRHGLVKRRTRRRNRATGTALCVPGQPNDAEGATRIARADPDSNRERRESRRLALGPLAYATAESLFAWGCPSSAPFRAPGLAVPDRAPAQTPRGLPPKESLRAALLSVPSPQPPPLFLSRHRREPQPFCPATFELAVRPLVPLAAPGPL